MADDNLVPDLLDRRCRTGPRAGGLDGGGDVGQVVVLQLQGRSAQPPVDLTGLRAPTIAPVTPGQASVQATATAATRRRAARRPAAARRPGPVGRQSRLGEVGVGGAPVAGSRRAARAAVNAPVSRPEAIGL